MIRFWKVSAVKETYKEGQKSIQKSISWIKMLSHVGQNEKINIVILGGQKSKQVQQKG